MRIHYTNIDERYGDPVRVTIDDYKELNPGGNFTQDQKGIYEFGVLIAEAVEESDQDESGEIIAEEIAAVINRGSKIYPLENPRYEVRITHRGATFEVGIWDNERSWWNPSIQKSPVKSPGFVYTELVVRPEFRGRDVCHICGAHVDSREGFECPSCGSN